VEATLKDLLGFKDVCQLQVGTWNNKYFNAVHISIHSVTVKSSLISTFCYVKVFSYCTSRLSAKIYVELIVHLMHVAWSRYR